MTENPTPPLSPAEQYDLETIRYAHEWATYYLCQAETPIYLEYKEFTATCLVAAILHKEKIIALTEGKTPSRVGLAEGIINYLAVENPNVEFYDMEVLYTIAIKVITNLGRLYENWKLFEETRPGRGLRF